MLNYESLGPTPAGEDCIQIGDANYSNKAGSECSRYRDLLKLKFPEAGKYGCSFHRKSFKHEFGTYYEIVVQFDDSRGEALEYAYFVEANIPEFWGDTNVPHFTPDLENAYA